MRPAVPSFVVLAAVLACGFTCGQATPAQEPASSSQTASAEYDALVKEYAKADATYRKALDAATRAGGAAPKDPANPAIEHYARFEAIAAKGEGRALLWLAAKTGAAHPERTKAENKAESWKLYERVVDGFADATWINAFASTLTTLYVEHGAEKVDPLLDRFVERSKNAEAVAEALYRGKEEARRGKRDERMKALEQRLVKDFPETRYGRKARGVEEPAQTGPIVIGVGKVAPDFTTKDTDGVEFKLSDYRGKVVVLDFWGFW